MADNIDVAPSIEKGRVAVATDEQGDTHIPIYEDLNLAIPQGKIVTISPVNKFGGG